MAIAFDAVNSAAPGFASSVSYYHACAGSDRILLVWVVIDRFNGATAASAVTYNGVALSRYGSNYTDGSHGIDLWYLVAPATGSNQLSVTITGTMAKPCVVSLSYTGVHQSSPLGTIASAYATSTNPTVNVSSGANELVVDCANLWTTAITATVGADQTERANIDTGSYGDILCSEQAGEATTVMSWTSVADSWLARGVPLLPASTAAGIPKTTRQTLLGVG